jgi:hypothetical protein
MKSLAWWKHEFVAVGTYTVMIILMIVTRPFNNNDTWQMFEHHVFGWLERGHVDE